MGNRFISFACFTLMCTALCSSTIGAPSGLNMMPTADVLDKGVISVETESAGAGNPWGEDCDTFALLQFGIGNGIEIGVDKCMSDSNSWLNFKWRVLDEKGTLPAIALGAQTINGGHHPEPYAAATKTLGKSRLHSGFIGIEHKTRWMIGVDHPIGNLITFQADYINGSENSATYGIALSLTDNLSLTVAKTNGNSADIGSGHLLNIAWSKTLD